MDGDTVKIGELSLREKIGQKFMFGVVLDNVDIIVDLIKNVVTVLFFIR